MARSRKTERTGVHTDTTKQRTEENKKKFIAKLKEMPIIQVAAAQVGIHRDTYYEWRTNDRRFKERCDEALMRGKAFLSDMAESVLVKKIKEGNLTAIIFFLKNHHLQYNDKRYHEHEHYFRDDPLTEERQEQIEKAMRAWAEPDEGTDRDEDYEFPSLQKVEDGKKVTEPQMTQEKTSEQSMTEATSEIRTKVIKRTTALPSKQSVVAKRVTGRKMREKE